MSEENKAKSTQSESDALAKAQGIYQMLLTTQQSAVLATINTDGSPNASYTPFAIDSSKNFYIFISTLAHHTQNLLDTTQASLMVIADEVESTQIFARQRLTFSCRVEELERDSDDWKVAAILYEQRFGEMFKLIRGFKDFKMFRLVPKDGLLVVGFGQAYTLHGNELGKLILRRGETSNNER